MFTTTGTVATFAARLDSLTDSDQSYAVDVALSAEDMSGFYILTDGELDELSSDDDYAYGDDVADSDTAAWFASDPFAAASFFALEYGDDDYAYGY